MAHTFILYDSSIWDRNGLFFKAQKLLDEGHPVQQEKFSSGRLTITTKMWIEFETEEEAALWKLTYL
jgi:hypothetical protein